MNNGRKEFFYLMTKQKHELNYGYEMAHEQKPNNNKAHKMQRIKDNPKSLKIIESSTHLAHSHFTS